MINTGGIKLNATMIIIAVIVLLLLIGIGWYFYSQGKKGITIQALPGQLPGSPSSGNVTGASNDEIKDISNGIYQDIKGFNLLGHSLVPYDRAVLLNDTDIIKLYNAFNTQYQSDLGETLTQALQSEYYLRGQSPDILKSRLEKLNSI